MARESALRQRTMLLLKENGFFAQAIESSTNPGMPDIWYVFTGGVSGWVECKMLKIIPARAETSLFKSANHGLSPEQEIFITRCVAKNLPCAILVAYERRYFLVPGKYAQAFNTYTFAMLQKFEVSKSDIPILLRFSREKQL